MSADSINISFHTDYSIGHQTGTTYTYVLQSSYSKCCSLDLWGSNTYNVSINSPDYAWYVSGSNLMVDFRGTNPTTFTINFECTSSGNEDSQFRVRKIVAALYGFDYGSAGWTTGTINTIPDLDVPYNNFSPDLSASKYTSNTINLCSSMLSNDLRNIKRIDSDLFFFSRHGGSDGIQGPAFDKIYNTDIPYLSCCRISVLSSCESSKTPTNGSQYSIAQEFVVNGADSSIGWNKTISSSFAKTFTNKLFNELNEGKTISEAASIAKAQFLFGNIKDFIIFGDASTKMFSNGSDMLDLSMTPLSLDQNYYYEDCGNNYYQIYRTVNGRLTNQVILAIKNRENYYLISKSDNSEKSYITLDDKYSSKVYDIIRQIVNDNNKMYDMSYYSFYDVKNGVATPILIFEFSCLTKEYSENKIIGVNLNNGQIVDPFDCLEVQYEKY